MKTIVIGLGNPILTDDGVGWRVAEQVAGCLEAGAAIEVDCLSVGGLSLMERLIGYQRAVLVDAIVTGNDPPGTVLCFPIEELPLRAIGHFSSAHDATLPDALKLGRSLGVVLPERIDIVAVEADIVYDFGEQLTPAVEAAVPQAVQRVLEILAVI